MIINASGTVATMEPSALLRSSCSPEILKAYAASNNITNPRWRLLTGEREYLYRIAKTAYFASEDLGETTGPDQFLHTENLLLIDQDGRIRGVYNGLSASAVQHLIDDIRLLLNPTQQYASTQEI